MKKFMDENFLLSTKTAEMLYHEYAKDMPIYDFHCHLSPKDIAEDKTFSNIGEIWLAGDHYKWRAMRSNGVIEKYCTGDGTDEEKFMEWAKTVPYTIGNPLYHWTHLELKKYFNIHDQLSEENAKDIWEKGNAIIKTTSAKKLIVDSNVKVICTTDDPLDDLKYHIKLREDGFEVKVLPTFRPDKAINIELKWFIDWVGQLGKISNTNIDNIYEFEKALEARINYFHEVGCRVSDHALDKVMYAECSSEEANVIFKKGLNGDTLTTTELKKYKGYMMGLFGRKYSDLSWVMQLHIGALRNNSKRMLDLIGPDTGFDSINDPIIAEDLSNLLDSLDYDDKLPKTILYTLNPRDNEVIGTMIGNFQGGGIPGKIQFGSGWWFNDQKDGMERQLEALSQLGLLSRFVGMLTDSRSFLSYTRHEYFRRILCNKIGLLVENGEYPNNIEFLGKIVQDICFNNAANYFDI